MMGYKLFAILGSIGMIGFGMWHFFVPTIWKWYSYIVPEATELVLAVRATNFFFSLSLVLIGALNIALVANPQTSKNAIVALLLVSILLWSARVVLQIVLPQGTMNATLQSGMTAGFCLILILFVSALKMYFDISK